MGHKPFPKIPGYMHPSRFRAVALANNSRVETMKQSYEISQPAAVALADGFTPTRVFRTDAGLSVGLLAARTGLSIARIADIEAGNPPHLAELRALGKALTVPADLLADTE
jgi:hypothetical protein